MTAVYTWDVFSTLDGYGSYAEGGDWGGYWGKQGPELLEHRAALFDTEQRMVYGATTFREMAEIFSAATDPHTLDEWNVRTMQMPATVVSTTLQEPLDWPDATVASGDAVDVATENLRGVGQGLTTGELQLVRTEKGRVPAELLHAGLEGVAGAGARMLKEHAQRLPGKV